MNKNEIMEQFAQYVSSGKVEFYQQVGLDFVMGERHGIYMADIETGQKLINCHSNGGVFNLGHRHPRIIAALKKALEQVDIGNHHLISGYRSKLAKQLADISPDGLNQVVFGVSGGEIVDTAIKFARAHTGRMKIISAQGGYHGHTGLALATGDEQYRKPFGKQPPDFVQLPFNDIDALRSEIDENTAAVILETIPATLGMPMPTNDYFAEVRQLCDQYGVILIMDEIQTGLGRCGAFWGIDTYAVVPDIIVTGKGLSGGIYPITAMIYKDELHQFFHNNPFIHISTFGGSELGCVVASEVINMLQEPDFLTHIKNVASIFVTGFSDLQKKHPQILVETRQRGLMMALKMVHDSAGMVMSAIGIQHGIFTVYANNDKSVSQILPPLIITEEETKTVLTALDKSLSVLESMR